MPGTTCRRSGAADEGLWHCTAFGGHGLNTTAVGGRLIAAAIAEGDDRYRLFAPFGLAWNGGPFGPVAAQLTYWKMQAAGLVGRAQRRAARRSPQKKVATAP